MNLIERQIAAIKPHLPGVDVILLQLIEHAHVKLPAVWTLVIGELHHGDRRILGAQHLEAAEVELGVRRPLRRILLRHRR